MDTGRASRPSLRQRAYEMLERGVEQDALERAVHGTLIALVLLNVAVVVLESVPAYAAAYGGLFDLVEAVTLVVFTVEYGLRLWSAPEHGPWRHLPSWRARLHWALQPQSLVDLVAVAPFYAALLAPGIDLRALLILRLFRFFKLARYSPGLTTLLEAVYSERRGLAASGVILAGTVLLTASFMHVAEHAAQPDKFGTIPDAMYWAVITLATVGYGDVVPVTPVGKVIAGLTAVSGIVMLALPVGILASAFAREIQKRDFVVTWGMVASVPLFARLHADELREIMDRLYAKFCEEEEIIVRRGEAAEAMYFIASGQVEIELPDQPVRLGAGDFFGEMAILTRSERTATVKALERCKLLVLDAADLHMLMDHSPRMAEHIRAVAEARAAPPASGDKTVSGAAPDGLPGS